MHWSGSSTRDLVRSLVNDHVGRCVALRWSIARNAVRGLDPTNGRQVVSILFGGYANHFPTPSAGDVLLLLPGTDPVFAFMGPAGLPPPPPLSSPAPSPDSVAGGSVP
jgi:hypothetical protein